MGEMQLLFIVSQCPQYPKEEAKQLTFLNVIM